MLSGTLMLNGHLETRNSFNSISLQKRRWLSGLRRCMLRFLADLRSLAQEAERWFESPWVQSPKEIFLSCSFSLSLYLITKFTKYHMQQHKKKDCINECLLLVVMLPLQCILKHCGYQSIADVILTLLNNFRLRLCLHLKPFLLSFSSGRS